jgi:hypothetical protein
MARSYASDSNQKPIMNSRIDKDFSLSVDEKLCCCAMEVANKYDNHHELTSDAPSMLYSLIREIPEFFSQFIVDERVDQQMKKRQRVLTTH